MPGHTENAFSTWATPPCPFTIEYAPHVLDDIRLAVVDAFFSLPHGGAEIGGILLGTRGAGRLTIAGYEALDCEHAFGPGFTLSARDKAYLAEMLAAERPLNLRPVGWYHSHTRSQIFLSDADLEIYQRYFPEPWQVALVMKPHTFQPARAGFFFREPDGRIHGSASYLEFQVEQMAVRPAPAGVPPVEKREPPPRMAGAASRAGFGQPAKTVAPAPPLPVAEPALAPPERPAAPEAARPDIKPEAVPQSAAGPAPDFAPPPFLELPPEPSRGWLTIAVPLAVGVALGSAGYATRQDWLPQLLPGYARLHGAPSGSVAAPAPPAPLPALGLSVLDNDGQLQIRWDRNSPAVRNGGNALLEILDSGLQPRAIPLDQQLLRTGFFTYGRKSGRVDLVLVVDQPNNNAVRETATFLGRPADAPQGESEAALRNERDDLVRRNAKLESDLKAANALNQSLEHSLSDMRKLLIIRERLKNQVPR